MILGKWANIKLQKYSQSCMYIKWDLARTVERKLSYFKLHAQYTNSRMCLDAK